MSNARVGMPGLLFSWEDNLRQSWNESYWESDQLMLLVKSTQYLKPKASFTDNKCILYSGSSVATFCIFPACCSNVCLLLGLFPSKEGFGARHFPAHKLFLVLASCFQTVVLFGGLEGESLRPKQEVVWWVVWELVKLSLSVEMAIEF